MHAENSHPTVLCFAGLDPSGGAGLQADIETIASCGGHALPIATCLTVQSSVQAFSFSAVDTNIIQQQFNALKSDMHISACKIGVIPNASIASCVATLIQQLPGIPIIYDPVLAASNGSQFSSHSTIDIIKSDLLPHITVLTPNISEINTLLDTNISEITQASVLCQLGPSYVLATDADSESEHVNNVLISSTGLLEDYQYQRLPHQYHGSGCTLSSALTCYLAQNLSIKKAVKFAQDFTYQTLKNAHAIGQGQWIPNRMLRS